MNTKMAVIIIVALLAIGVGGYVVGQNFKFIRIPPQQKRLGNDQNPCKPGFKLADDICLPEQSDTTTVTLTPTPTIDETEVLKVAIKQQIVAKRGGDASGLTISVSKIEGNFAQGGATEQGGGGMWFAAKVNGSWKLAWDGNGTIGCEDIAPYNFPISMIPECWSNASQKLIKR